MRPESGALEGSATKEFDEEVVVDGILVSVGDAGSGGLDSWDDGEEELKAAHGHEKLSRSYNGRR